MDWLAHMLKAHPELALFLTLAIGYAIGKIKFGSVQLGAVTGVLITGVVIGQVGVTVSSDLKSAFFLLFLFSIGYKTGPQFVNGLKSSGLSQVGLTVLLAVTGLATAYAVARVFGFDAGTGAGLLAGALTESAAMGTAADAVKRLGVDAAATQALTTNITVAFAVTYFLGVITTLTVLARLGPKLMRVDLVAACRELEREMGATPESQPGVVSGYFEFVIRAYMVPSSFDGKTVGNLEGMFGDARIFVSRIRQNGRIVEGRPDMVLHTGDTLTLGGRREHIVSEGNPLRHSEIEDRELLDFANLSLDVMLTNKQLHGRTLGELGQDAAARGVFLRRLTRGGEELPFTPRTKIERGDVLSLVGGKSDVERVAAQIGYPDRPTSATDMTTVGAAIFLGGLIGIPAIMIGKLEIGLSLSVGTLVGGLFFGWLRSVDRRFASIPEPTLWLFDSVGLAAFLAATGLGAGPDFIKGLKESGLSLVVAGLLCTTIPIVVTMLVGRYVVKMHPGILLGVCAGAATSAPGLASVQEVAKSKIPTLGYGVTYAVGNVFLALWGTVMVTLLSR